MAVFLFLVGLEIKREVMEGELTNAAQITLPALAAVGGMAVPAAIYAALWNTRRQARVRRAGLSHSRRRLPKSSVADGRG